MGFIGVCYAFLQQVLLHTASAVRLCRGLEIPLIMNPRVISFWRIFIPCQCPECLVAFVVESEDSTPMRLIWSGEWSLWWGTGSSALGWGKDTNTASHEVWTGRQAYSPNIVYFVWFIYYLFCLFPNSSSLCSPRCPETLSRDKWLWTQWYSSLCLMSAQIKGLHHHPACIFNRCLVI